MVRAALPSLATALEIAPDEVDPFREYRTYIWLMAEFTRTA